MDLNDPKKFSKFVEELEVTGRTDLLIFADDMAAAMARSLADVSHAFGPRERIHGMLTNERFNNVLIDGYSLQEAIGSWYKGGNVPVKLIAE